MARGGRREGAGRKAGASTKRTREIADKAMAEGLTPLEFMLNVLRDEKLAFKERYAAAVDAAPYLHPKLANVQHSGDAENPVETVTRIELTTPDDYSPNRAAAEADTHIHRVS